VVVAVVVAFEPQVARRLLPMRVVVAVVVGPITTTKRTTCRVVQVDSAVPDVRVARAETENLHAVEAGLRVLEIQGFRRLV
jgi:hypothetical protein